MEKKTEEKQVEEKVDRKNITAILKKHKEEVEGNLKARLLDGNFEVVKEVPVRDLVKLLKSNNVKAQGIVFDGVITQRVVDLAAKRNITLLVGVRMGSVVKVPSNVSIMTFDQI